MTQHPISGHGASGVANMGLTPEKQQGLRDFWEAYQANYEAISSSVMAAVRQRPEFLAILQAMDGDHLTARRQAARALLRRAIEEENWEPYLSHLHEDGVRYADSGIGLTLWYRLMNAFREPLLPILYAAYGNDRDRFVAAVLAMDELADVAMGVIGQAYLDRNETLLKVHEEAIRELSTPVLTLRPGLLVVPLIGVVDTRRAQDLTRNLLIQIRDKRAKAVILDVTGVVAVDSKVANHILQTVAAARLMGATTIVTGISPDVAQTMVTIGADLGAVQTATDLQAGLEQARPILGYRIIEVHDAAGEPQSRSGA